MRKVLFLLISILICYGCQQKPAQKVENETSMSNLELARQLSQDLIIVDTHIDVPYRLYEDFQDISQRTEGGHFDFVRAKQGGLNAPFMSIYVDAKYQETGGAKDLANELIDLVEKFTTDWPDKFAIASSVEQIEEQFKTGLISLPMGIENGAPIENDISNIKYFYDRGVRYITLTHGKWNQICDSSYDPDKHWNGLSPFGREVVVEMNRIGMMVDISHVSDSTFYQVMNLTKAPVIASHSSCRHYTPGMERNMSDDMIKKLAENGGVIQINFGSFFLNSDYYVKMDKAWKKMDSIGTSMTSEERQAWRANYKIENKVPEVQLSEVADHIDHVVELVGINHVGLGSDYDGVSDLPSGLGDVSTYPALIEELLNRGYSKEDIEKICNGNIFRVWKEVEKVAASEKV